MEVLLITLAVIGGLFSLFWIVYFITAFIIVLRWPK